jgi:thiol-disulfide isomerase/thioredoxin
VVVYARAGCHLCDVARPVVAEVAGAAGVDWVEVDVDTDPELAARYGELVPAVTVDGVLTDYWRIDPVRLGQALA